MSLKYLPEFATPARIALALAEQEAKHLRYTVNTLFTETIDLEWVHRLEDREDMAEKIDAFVGRFGRLQDHLGEKLLPIFIKLQGGQSKSLLIHWPTPNAWVGLTVQKNLLVPGN